MKNLLTKFMSILLVMILLIQGTSTVAMAQSVSAQGASIQETKIDTRTTKYLINSNKGAVTMQETIIDSYTKEYLINDSTTGELSLLRLETKASGERIILGWFISDGENISSQSDSNYDFTMEKTNDTITYKESGKNAIIAATITSQTEAIPQAMPITPNISFPTPWNCERTSLIAELKSLAIDSIIGVLLLISPIAWGVAQSVAMIIQSLGSMLIYYTTDYWSRALSLLEHERYFVYTFYKNSDYTNQYHRHQTSNEVIYLG